MSSVFSKKKKKRIFLYLFIGFIICILLYLWSRTLPVPVIATYKGTLPCADCPGIDATLVLYQDNTFSQTYIYRERDTTFITQGTWDIKKDIPKNISFPVYEFIEKGAANATFYGVKDNQLVPLDSDFVVPPAPYNAPLVKQ